MYIVHLGYALIYHMLDPTKVLQWKKQKTSVLGLARTTIITRKKQIANSHTHKTTSIYCSKPLPYGYLTVRYRTMLNLMSYNHEFTKCYHLYLPVVLYGYYAPTW